MAFLAQKLTYTINIRFNFVFRSSFKQDHLLNLIILGVYAKVCTHFKTETDVSQNLIDDFFLFFFSVRRILSGGKYGYGGTGLISEKTEALYAELNKRAAAATSRYSQTGDFLQHIYSVLVAKN